MRGQDTGGEPPLTIEDRPQGVGPLATAALCWIGGCVLSVWWQRPVGWLLVAVVPCAVMIFMALRARPRAVVCWGMLAAIPLGAAWSAVRMHHVPTDHVTHYLHDEPVLARFTGVVDESPLLTAADGGAFEQFSWKAPVTWFSLRLETTEVDVGVQSCSGRLRVRIAEADHRLRAGDRIEATGWLSRVRGPDNPGELDYRRIFRRRDIDGRLNLANRDNWRFVERVADSWWQSLRAMGARTAAASVRLGMTRGDEEGAARLGLLDAMLLGRRDANLWATHEGFRRVGLAHLLSISGAHLAILLGIVWLVARSLTGYPPRAAALVLAVLGLYMLVVPWRVPILRASVMAALFALATCAGRRTRPMQIVALAALLVLVLEPADLFSAGFQLSFGCVVGLLLFTTALSRWMLPPLPIEQPRGFLATAARRGSVYLAANLVAYAVAAPLVAHYFRIVTPFAVILSLLSLPVVSIVLGLGYLKIVVGLLWPSLGIMLASPLERATDLMTLLVERAAEVPGATIELSFAPSVWWTIGAEAVVAAIFAGWFAQRRAALIAAVGLSALWLVASQRPSWFDASALMNDRSTTLKLNVLAVGDGSCYLARFGRGKSAHVLMFDCGSVNYGKIGIRTVPDALRELGVRRIDTLVISHADFDHFGGVLDLADRVEVGRVLVPPQLLAEARDAQPPAAPSFLIEQLQARGLRVHEVSAGWRQRHGGVVLDMLWPPADFSPKHANDGSLVLSIRIDAAPGGVGRRVLLCGDIQQEAIRELIATGADLSADVCDLPHHGSFVKDSPRWLDAVGPAVVVQSCGHRRLRNDPWQALLSDNDIRRYVTARDGMVTLKIRESGEMLWDKFR
jgi:competence protein ComEC